MIYFFSNIGYWYRAKLLKLDQDIAEVIFFDYEDKQDLPVEWIRRLSQKDQCIPHMAVRCKLSAVDLDVWPDKATPNFDYSKYFLLFYLYDYHFAIAITPTSIR